jgi:endoglucanase
MNTRWLQTFAGLGLVIGMTTSSTTSGQSSTSVFEVNKLLARTVNFGNALEAPSEGAWGMRLEERFFDLVKSAGFSAIRLPTKFSAHAAETAPYKLDRDFILRVDWAIQNAKKRGLAIIVDLHHYDELINAPEQHKDRWLGIWKQLAERYKNQPQRVIFELCNEPNGKLEPFWNAYLAEALTLVRQTNKVRAVIVGPNGWNNADRLTELTLPNDPNLILTFHNYTPFEFTHQGAEWWADGDKHLGTPWKGTDADKTVVTRYLEKAVAYAKSKNLPVFMGEFGAYGKADIQSRVRWTTYTRQEAEVRGFSWGYWEFGAGFGVYDRLNDAWRMELLKALLPNAKP